MATYQVTDEETGLTLELTGDSPPTDEELADLFSQHQQPQMQQSPPQQEQPFDFSAMEMVKNIPGSAANLAGDLWGAVTDPVGTGKAVFGLAQSLGNKMGRNAAELVYGTKMDVMDGFSEDAANAVGEAMIDRYGSIDALKRTAQDDPVGFMTDVSGAGLVSRIPKVAKIGALAEPAGIAGKTARGAAKAAIPKDAAQNLYQSSAKFSTTLSPAERAALTKTALDNKILPNRSGVDEIQRKIEALDAKLDGLIDTATAKGTTVPVGAIERHIRELQREKGGIKIAGAQDLEAIDSIVAGFNKSIDGRTKISPRELQDFKVDAYGQIGFDVKRMQGSSIKDDTYKAMARGAKDTITDIIPDSADINRQMGDLIELRKPLSRSASRIDNRNIFGLDTAVKIGSGGALAGIPGMIAGAVISAVGSPVNKARVALIANKIKSGDTKWLEANATQAEIRAALAQAGRLEEEDD